MAAQHGLITRRQALVAGLAPEAIDRTTRQGSWVIVRRGVYTTRELWQSLPRIEDIQLTRDRAASLRIRRADVMSHDSAALELDLAILRAKSPTTHVTRPGVVGSHLRHWRQAPPGAVPPQRGHPWATGPRPGSHSRRHRA